jgi:hypothetical protein
MTMADEFNEAPTLGEHAMRTTGMNPRQLSEVDKVRAACAQAYDAILNATETPSREKSLAFTKIEEACMWAVKAISRGAK